MEKLQKIYPFVLFTIFISIAFWDLPKTFFQQDEWLGFGVYISNESYKGIAEAIKNTIVSDKVHFTPLANVGYYLQYKLFGMNFSFYGFVSIFIHILNTFLVYIFVSIVLRNKYLGLFSALLFAINSTSHQAVSWVAVSINTQGSTFFSLLSYLTFFIYLRKENTKILIVSFAIIIIALLFKETLVPFFLLPIMVILYTRKDIKTTLIRILKPFSLIFFFYTSLRIILFIFASPLVLGGVEAKQAGITAYAFRFIALPFRVVTQSIFPESLLLDWSDRIIHLAYPSFVASDGVSNPFLRESLVFDFVCFVIGIVIILFSFLTYRFFIKSKEEYLAKSLLLFISLIISGAFLIIFIPGRAGYASIIEPRHLYSGSFGSSGLLVLILFGACCFLAKRKGKLLLITILIPIYIFHLLIIKADIKQLEAVGKVRKDILSTIKQNYPKLQKKVLFYTQSDTAYYGMPDKEKILPVQIGFGKMLMIWYQKDELFPGCLYKDQFLIELLEQGYRFCKGRGFGYFRDYAELKSTIKTSNIPIENIIAFSWDGNTGEFMDITKNIQEKLKVEIPADEI